MVEYLDYSENSIAKVSLIFSNPFDLRQEFSELNSIGNVFAMENK